MTSVVIRKLEIIPPFRKRNRPDLQAKYVQAYALYWGWHIGYGEEEAFEIWDEGKNIA
jgi:hypothetical protein